MSHGTKRQKNKKNQNRPKAGDIGFQPSIQKRSYAPKKLSPSESLQPKLL